jgi:hypothetical protein
MARISKARAEIADYQADIKEYGLDQPVTAAQKRQLKRCGYKGATPSTQSQAKAILAKLKKGTRQYEP